MTRLHGAAAPGASFAKPFAACVFSAKAGLGWVSIGVLGKDTKDVAMLGLLGAALPDPQFLDLFHG